MCRTCDRYEVMGWGQQCPCTHVDGKCVNERGGGVPRTPTTAAVSGGAMERFLYTLAVFFIIGILLLAAYSISQSVT